MTESITMRRLPLLELVKNVSLPFFDEMYRSSSFPPETVVNDQRLNERSIEQNKKVKKYENVSSQANSDL